MRQLLFASLTAGLLLGPAPHATAEDDMRALIAKAIKAHGGKKKLTKFTAVQTKAKGKIEMFGGIAFTQEVAVQFPEKYKTTVEVEVQGQKFSIITVFNGKKAWLTLNGEHQKVDAKMEKAFK